MDPTQKLLVAKAVNGEVVEYPYELRPNAKRDHPDVTPLPGSWEQCLEQGLLEKLSAQQVIRTERIEEPDGFDVVEDTPRFNADGVLEQTWKLVGETPVPRPVFATFDDCTKETLPEPKACKYAVMVVINTKRGKCPCWSDGKYWLYLSDNTVVT